MKVQDLMTTPVLTCGPNDPLDVAARLMWEGDCGCIPVVDQDTRILGMVTDRDIAMAAYTRGRLLSEIPVSAAMSARPIVVKPKDDVSSVVERMSRAAVRRLPVIEDDGRVVGIVSLTDVARVAAQETSRPPGELGESLTLDRVGSTLASIGQGRQLDGGA